MATLTQSEIAELEHGLVAQGWTRQFTTFPNRVQEYIDAYEAMGLEVRVEPWALTFNEDASCDSCAVLGVMRTIFTRSKVKA